MNFCSEQEVGGVDEWMWRNTKYYQYRVLYQESRGWGGLREGKSGEEISRFWLRGGVWEEGIRGWTSGGNCCIICTPGCWVSKLCWRSESDLCLSTIWTVLAQMKTECTVQYRGDYTWPITTFTMCCAGVYMHLMWLILGNKVHYRGVTEVTLCVSQVHRRVSKEDKCVMPAF